VKDFLNQETFNDLFMTQRDHYFVIFPLSRLILFGLFYPRLSAYFQTCPDGKFWNMKIIGLLC
jgi:hypothetical protein